MTVSTAAPLSRFRLLQSGLTRASFADDVRSGLAGRPKSLPPRWFYDSIGSALFDAICFLPEYYVTRTETEVLQANAGAIVEKIGKPGRIVELGSGMARKTRILFDAMPQRGEYVPLDVDGGILERAGRDLLAEYPDLSITAIEADFTRPSVLSILSPAGGRTVVLFLGSTIGNLDPAEAAAMLTDLRRVLRPGDALLLGTDLKKDRSILEPAYDDPLGVTAAFNLNLLGRINRELGGEFDLASFAHRAFYDEAAGRIEMHLVSRRAQRIRINALASEFDFAEGETIHTESSWKQDHASLAALASASGFDVEEIWTDPRGWFADVLLRAAGR